MAQKGILKTGENMLQRNLDDAAQQKPDFLIFERDDWTATYCAALC
jgi:hypothetical protein